MKTKYLSDGRKVVVVGTLNQTESIVQEIHVTEDGDEIPGGEKFTAKGLFDERVETYAAREKRQEEQARDRAKSERIALQNDCRKVRNELKTLRSVFSASRKLSETMSDEDLETLSMFMSGSVKWLVFSNSWHALAPVRFEEAIRQDGDNRDPSRLRLLSLFGRADGSLTYNLSKWSDGSGGGGEVFPFEFYEDAIRCVTDLAKDKIADGEMSLGNMQKYLDMGCKFDEEDLEAVRESLLSSHRKSEARRVDKNKAAKLRAQEQREQIANLGRAS